VGGVSIYPEHDKLDAAENRIEIISEFLEWLRKDGVILVRETDPDVRSIDALLDDFLGLDQRKLADELAQIRAYWGPR
jgi:hypothetical protein